MNPVSVVIITRNEEANIVDCIRSARLLTQDIVVVDAESSDATVMLTTAEGARPFIMAWEGYGSSRNYGALQAKHNWILALDADERISPELVSAIQGADFQHDHVVYKFARKNFINDKKIKFGTPGFDCVARLYNRTHCKWNLALVHEALTGRNIETKRIRGYISHFSLKDPTHLREKAKLYASMCAEKYFREGKKPRFFRCFFSALFNSVKSFIFQAGFLDGRSGFLLAKNIAYYSWLKYDLLQRKYAEAARKQKYATPLHQTKSITKQVFSSGR